ncbi:hypothetical protein RB195_018585 [Necator americanus]|uniref:Reverse transcriptase domain-containing protein n=1 Tax=Necator americanus TaxID=51031 RepID=A0ABR1CE40_NECAM
MPLGGKKIQNKVENLFRGISNVWGTQQVEWTRMGLEQQSDALGKWHYPADGTSDNDDRPTLLKRQAPSAPELDHVQRLTHAANEESSAESKVLVCIQKMRNGKSGGDDGINAEMLKYLPPSRIREMTKIIRSI